MSGHTSTLCLVPEVIRHHATSVEGRLPVTILNAWLLAYTNPHMWKRLLMSCSGAYYMSLNDNLEPLLPQQHAKVTPMLMEQGREYDRGYVPGGHRSRPSQYHHRFRQRQSPMHPQLHPLGRPNPPPAPLSPPPQRLLPMHPPLGRLADRVSRNPLALYPTRKFLHGLP